MGWSVNFNDKAGVIETNYEGRMKKEELYEAINATILLIKEKNAYLLFGDCMNLEHDHTIFDIYEMVKTFENFDFVGQMKEAILMPVSKEALSDLRFYETAARNRGLNVRLFNDKNEAFAWLSGK